MRTMRSSSPKYNAMKEDASRFEQRMQKDAQRLESHGALWRIPYVEIKMLEAQNAKRCARRLEALLVVLAMTSMVVFLNLTVAVLLQVPLRLGFAAALLVLGFTGGVVAFFYILIQWINFKEEIPLWAYNFRIL